MKRGKVEVIERYRGSGCLMYLYYCYSIIHDLDSVCFCRPCKSRIKVLHPAMQCIPSHHTMLTLPTMQRRSYHVEPNCVCLINKYKPWRHYNMACGLSRAPTAPRQCFLCRAGNAGNSNELAQDRSLISWTFRPCSSKISFVDAVIHVPIRVNILLSDQ